MTSLFGIPVIENACVPKDTILLVNTRALAKPILGRGDVVGLDLQPWSEREAARIFDDLRGVLSYTCPLTAPPEWKRHRRPIPMIQLRAIYGGLTRHRFVSLPG